MKYRTSAKLILLIFFLLPSPSWTQTPPPIAIITKFKLGRTGEVFLTIPGEPGKQRADGRQHLTKGTKIEVLKDAEVEIYFLSGQSRTIAHSNSPYEVISPKAETKPLTDQWTDIIRVLTDSKKQVPRILRARGTNAPPLPLAPRRDTKIITRSPRFQWDGAVDPAATINVFGPTGLVWTTRNLPPRVIEYPKSAPALLPGVNYSWEIVLKDTKYSGGRFRVLTDDELGALKARLAEIESQSNLGKATRRVLQISYLISQELYYDARERLIQALETDGNEPTLLLLLAEVYRKTGLDDLAGEKAQIAADLATRGENRK
jgi:hypothetical protein